MSNPLVNFLSLSKENPVQLQIFSGESGTEQWHPYTEILFVLRGQADLLVEDKTYHLIAEDVCLINPYTHHQSNFADSTVLSIAFRLEDITSEAYDKKLTFELNSSNNTYSSRYDHTRSLIAQLVKVNASGDNLHNTLSLLHGLIAHLSDHFIIAPKENSPSSVKYKDRMADILNYINLHYKDCLSLTELAASQNLSAPYLSSFFEKNMGLTFMTYYNELRLSYVVNAMLTSDEPLESIALSNGFRDSRSFVTAFKKKYHCLPSVYRKEHFLESDYSNKPHTKQSSFSDSVDDLKSLAKYLSPPRHEERLLSTMDPPSQLFEAGSLSFFSEGIPLSHNFRKFCCVGSARQILYADVQSMLRQLQKDIGYEFIKFHGILSDEMMVYSEKDSGEVRYSFTLIDKVIDFLLSIQLKPLIQLSFMPLQLASDPSKLIFNRQFNTSPPKNMKKWLDLVRTFIHHLIARYGIRQVKSWLFCVWNEPDGSSESFGWKDSKEFFHFYKESYLAVKSIDSEFQFGTPSLLMEPALPTDWSDHYFAYCFEENCLPDFINLHYYDNSFSSISQEEISFSLSNIEKSFPLNTDPFTFTKFVNNLKTKLKKLKLNHLPMYLTEWNLTISHRDLINDTCFKSCYLMKNLLENYDRLNSFGYWVLSDFIEELQLSNDLFHGGLGLFTYNGIPKAHYNSFSFLKDLGDELIGKGNGWFITRSTQKIILLLYNYEHFSKLFASGILFDMTTENRYTPFNQMKSASFHLTLTELPARTCLIKEYYVNRQKGSSFDTWLRMGAEPMLHPGDEEFLKQEAQPGIHFRREQIHQGTLELNITLEPLEVRKIEIELSSS